MQKNWKKGFTLAELLVVVAIIGILVAISIPIFSRQLEKARESTDIANMRAAYALVATSILLDESVDGTKFRTFTSSSPAYYDLNGTLTASAPKAYGKGRTVNGGITYRACSDYHYDPNADYTTSVITVWADGDVSHVHWTAIGANNGGSASGAPAAGEFESDAEDFPESLAEGETFTVNRGNVYRYNGSIYIATNTETFNHWYCRKPEETDSVYLYIKPGKTTLSSSNLDAEGRMTVAVHVGDIYSDGDSFYVRKVDSDAFQSVGPDRDSQNWIKINRKNGSQK